MKHLDTLTSQYTPTELYDLTTDTIGNVGSGSNNAMLTSSEDIISIQKNGSICIEIIKEVDNQRYVISEKQLEMYDLYLLFELFENVYDNHLFKEEAVKKAREFLRTKQEKDD